MSGDTELQPALSYPIWYLIGGILLFCLVGGWIALVYIITRRKRQRTLQTLKPKPYVPPNPYQIQQKYIALINDVELSYGRHDVSSRAAHQLLGKLVRFYVYEVNGNRVDTFTLDQLQRSRYPAVTRAVSAYYPASFRRFSSGDVANSAQLAREAIMTWGA